MNLNNIKIIKEKIDIIANTIPEQLNIMYEQLIDLIVINNIIGFIIPKNTDELSIFPSIEIKKGLIVPLGSFNDLTVFDGFNDLNDKTREVLSNINEYCNFINIHTKYNIPEITKNFYLSINSYQEINQNNSSNPIFIDCITELRKKTCLRKLKNYEENRLK